MNSVFLLGGARSGKSLAAQKLADSLSSTHRQPVTVVVTAEAVDDEMTARIQRHREDRPTNWQVTEAPRSVPDAVRDADPNAIVLLDCVTIWLSNLMLNEQDDAQVESQVEHLVGAISGRPGHTVVVSNEVGLGVVPASPMGRRFRDLQGRANVRLADSLDRSFLVVAGRLLELARSDLSVL